MTTYPGSAVQIQMGLIVVGLDSTYTYARLSIRRPGFAQRLNRYTCRPCANVRTTPSYETNHQMVIDTYAIVHDYTTLDVPDYAPMLGQSAGLGNGRASGNF